MPKNVPKRIKNTAAKIVSGKPVNTFRSNLFARKVFAVESILLSYHMRIKGEVIQSGRERLHIK
jgi:hypothetical protein